MNAENADWVMSLFKAEQSSESSLIIHFDMPVTLYLNELLCFCCQLNAILPLSLMKQHEDVFFVVFIFWQYCRR